MNAVHIITTILIVMIISIAKMTIAIAIISIANNECFEICFVS